MRRRYWIWLTLLLSGCAGAPTAPLPTVTAVDLNRYMGDWFEIAMLPNFFQSACVADTKARYERDGDVVKVLNRCRKADGNVDGASGIAKVVEGSGNAKLRVSFFRPFYGDYWVLDLDPEYRWVLVGEPSRRYAWILSRTPQLTEVQIKAALAKMAALGFDRAAFKRTPQREEIR